jgi:thymidylate kinase
MQKEDTLVFGPVFVVFEGLDSVGKTTSAKALADAIGGKFMPWLQEPYRTAIRALWSSSIVSENSSHLVFLAALRHLSELVRIELSNGTSVVTDRYVYSTIAVHPELTLASGNRPIILTLKDLDLLRPDFSFFLNLSEPLRIERATSRGEEMSPPEKLYAADNSARLRVINRFNRQIQLGDLIQLDIDTKSPLEIVDYSSWIMKNYMRW